MKGLESNSRIPVATKEEGKIMGKENNRERCSKEKCGKEGFPYGKENNFAKKLVTTRRPHATGTAAGVKKQLKRVVCEHFVCFLYIVSWVFVFDAENTSYQYQCIIHSSQVFTASWFYICPMFSACISECVLIHLILLDSR